LENPGDVIMGNFVDYLDKKIKLGEVLEQLSESLVKGKTEYACSEKLSVADFCMVSLSEEIKADEIAAELVARASTGL